MLKTITKLLKSVELDPHEFAENLKTKDIETVKIVIEMVKSFSKIGFEEIKSGKVQIDEKKMFDLIVPNRGLLHNLDRSNSAMLSEQQIEEIERILSAYLFGVLFHNKIYPFAGDFFRKIDNAIKSSQSANRIYSIFFFPAQSLKDHLACTRFLESFIKDITSLRQTEIGEIKVQVGRPSEKCADRLYSELKRIITQSSKSYVPTIIEILTEAKRSAPDSFSDLPTPTVDIIKHGLIRHKKQLAKTSHHTESSAEITSSP